MCVCVCACTCDLSPTIVPPQTGGMGNIFLHGIPGLKDFNLAQVGLLIFYCHIAMYFTKKADKTMSLIQ